MEFGILELCLLVKEVFSLQQSGKTVFFQLCFLHVSVASFWSWYQVDQRQHLLFQDLEMGKWYSQSVTCSIPTLQKGVFPMTRLLYSSALSVSRERASARFSFFYFTTLFLFSHLIKNNIYLYIYAFKYIHKNVLL